jgi:diacylglycerol O-acyltransferase
MVDGVAGTDLMTVLLDAERDAARPAPAGWTPAPSPGAGRLFAGAIAERAMNPLQAAGQLGVAVQAPRELARLLEDTSRGLAGFAGAARGGEPSSLNGALGPHRRWDWARAGAGYRPERRLEDGRDPRMSRGVSAWFRLGVSRRAACRGSARRCG